jgi:hypothetical protein
VNITCGDVAAPPLGTVTYYLAGYHTLTAGPACLVATGNASVVNLDYAGATDCYRWDDDSLAGGNYQPLLSPACP